MIKLFKTKEPKNEAVNNGQKNGRNNKSDKERIRRVKKSFLPSWMRETQNPKSKLS